MSSSAHKIAFHSPIDLWIWQPIRRERQANAVECPMFRAHCPKCCHFSPTIPLMHSNIRSARENWLQSKTKMLGYRLVRDRRMRRKSAISQFCSGCDDGGVGLCLIHTRCAEGTHIIHIMFQCWGHSVVGCVCPFFFFFFLLLYCSLVQLIYVVF